MNAMDEADVIVVGAGIAGLTTARQVAEAGRSVVVLEARDRVGGRTVDHTLDAGAVVEMGGQWVGPAQSEVLALIDELGLDTFPTHDEGEHLTVLNGSMTRFADETLGLPEDSLPEIGRLQAELESLAATVPLAAPWSTPGAATLDQQTLESWLTAHTGDDVALRFFRFVAQGLFSAESWQLSLLHFLFYIRSSSMLDNMVSTTGGAQERRVVGGSQRISERLAEDLGEDALRLATPVREVRQDATRVTVVHNRGEARARHAIVTLPPTLAGRLRYSPALPARRDSLTQQMPMGSVIKIQVAYPRPFWRDDGLSGQTLSLDDAVSLTFDNSPADGSLGVLLGFIEGDHARVVADQPLESRRKLVIDCLRRFFGSRAGDPIEYTEKDWMAEEYTRGCYGGRLGAGTWTAYGPALTEPIGRVHWAGSETADVSNGYMDGAVRSGHRAAAEVLDALATS